MGGKVAFPFIGLLATGLNVKIAEISSGLQSDNSFIPSLNFSLELVLLLNALILLKLSSNCVFFFVNSAVLLTSLLYLATRFVKATSGVSFRSSSCSFLTYSLVFLGGCGVFELLLLEDFELSLDFA